MRQRALNCAPGWPTATHPSAAPVHFEHWCEHPGCKDWGGFGFELDKSKSDWFCMEHRPEIYRGIQVRWAAEGKQKAAS